MSKKIGAIITAPGHEPYRIYFEERLGMVYAWTRTRNAGGYLTSSFNDGKFSRDWVREFFADKAEVEF